MVRLVVRRSYLNIKMLFINTELVPCRQDDADDDVDTCRLVPDGRPSGTEVSSIDSYCSHYTAKLLQIYR